MKPKSKRKLMSPEIEEKLWLYFLIGLGLILTPLNYGIKGIISIFKPTETYVFSDDEKTNT